MFLFLRDLINLRTVKNVSINILVGGHKLFCLFIFYSRHIMTLRVSFGFISLKSELKLLNFTHFAPSLSGRFFQWNWKLIQISKNNLSEILGSVCVRACEIHIYMLLFTSNFQRCLHDSIISFDNCWKPFNLFNQKRKLHFAFRYRFSNHFNSITVEIKLSHANSFIRTIFRGNFNFIILKFWRKRAA